MLIILVGRAFDDVFKLVATNAALVGVLHGRPGCARSAYERCGNTSHKGVHEGLTLWFVEIRLCVVLLEVHSADENTKADANDDRNGDTEG